MEPNGPIRVHLFPFVYCQSSRFVRANLDPPKGTQRVPDIHFENHCCTPHPAPNCIAYREHYTNCIYIFTGHYVLITQIIGLHVTKNNLTFVFVKKKKKKKSVPSVPFWYRYKVPLGTGTVKGYRDLF